jgi:bacillithiol biosynthesis cysteine-adding enzyme BshC
MGCQCVRQTDLPNTSALFADILYRPDRTSGFFPYPYRNLGDFQAAARAIKFPEERRAALLAALRAHNPEGLSLQRLAQPGTLAVVTGQQVGLFSGPAYTLYKVLHAVKLAEWLTAHDLPAVPVFWLATEDHDFAEVNHAWVFDSSHQPTRLEMHRSAAAQPVGDVRLMAPPLEALRAALAGFPYADEVCATVEESYLAGSTMGLAFGSLLRRLLSRFDVLQVDPMLPAFRALAGPVLRSAVEAAPDLTLGILARNQELIAAGYHAQVHMEEQTSLVFLLENGKRLGLRRHGSDYVLNGRRFSSGELMDRAEWLSPNAILRPVVQDAMLPTVAYIGGPAETAYLAQSEIIYRAILGRMPVAVPRAGFTILDARSHKLMDRYGLTLSSFFHGEDSLREQVAARLVPPTLQKSIQESAALVNNEIHRLHGELRGFDATLAKALNSSAGKIRYQLDKIERKAGREALRRDARAAQDAASLYGLIYPQRHLQERLYSMLPFLAKHGPSLIDQVYDAIQLDCPDHRLMVV